MNSIRTLRAGTDPVRAVQWPGGAAAAGARAFEVFCTPGLSTRRAENHDALVARARFHLRGAASCDIATSLGPVRTYTFEPDTGPPAATVLLVHGWTAEAAFLGAFAEYLRRKGLRAILMDLPAHGESSGARTSLIDCGRAVLEVAEAVGSVRFALGHSIGAMAVLLAAEGHPPLSRAFPFEAFVLLAMPDRFTDVTRDFSDEMSLAPAARAEFESRLETIAHRPLAAFTGGNLLAASGMPALLLHSTDDSEVPYSNAVGMAHLPGVTLQPFDGLGHRAILYAPPVVRAATSFLLERSRTPRSLIGA